MKLLKVNNKYKMLDKINEHYTRFNDFIYKYLVFLYYKQGFKKIILCGGIGLLSSLALPPLYLFIILPYTFATVMRVTDFCQKKVDAYKVGFYFSYGFGFGGFYWASFSLFSDFGSYWWLFPIALFGIPAVFAAFNAILFPIYLYLGSYSSAIRKNIIFAFLWVAFEYLRGYVILMFPWNFIGYSVSCFDDLIQFASVFGVLGMSLFVVMWALSFHLLMLTGDKDDFVKYMKYLIGNNIWLIMMVVFGVFRLHNEPVKFYENTILRIVQGDSAVQQNQSKESKLKTYIDLTNSLKSHKPQFIIWPEGAIDSLVYNDQDVRERIIKDLDLKPWQFLLTGAMRYDYDKNDDLLVYNSMVMISPNGGIATYDKHRLVPFGEYIPFSKSLPFLSISADIGNFTEGSGSKTAFLTNHVPPFIPLICYEIAFSGEIVPTDYMFEPKWILNITNDKWFWYSSEPFQHLQMAKVRAIEEGLSVVRVANSGKSAVIDPYGRKVVVSGIGEKYVKDVKLPLPAAQDTIFRSIGNAPLLIAIFSFLIFQFFMVVYESHDRKINKTFYSFYEMYSRINKNISKKDRKSTNNAIKTKKK